MKTVYTIFALLAASSVFAKTYTIGSGKWNDTKVWNNEYIGSTIKADDQVIVTGDMTINTPIVVEGKLVVEKGASFITMKDLVIAKGGTFVNLGNTVAKNIINEGNINNKLSLDAINNIDNTSKIENSSNITAGNNFNHNSGELNGKGGAVYVNNLVSASSTAKFGADVKVFYGSAIETASYNSNNKGLKAELVNNTVELSTLNKVENAALFSIEKSSDGVSFKFTDLVKANNSGLKYTDTKIHSEITYYRVKAISSMGEETTLPIASAKAPFANAFSMITE